MSTSIEDSCAIGVLVDDGEIHIRVRDGRTISAPIAWFPRLANSTDAERANWRLIGDGEGAHWPQLDEDISIAALLRGR